jgi:hypothetical protein
MLTKSLPSSLSQGVDATEKLEHGLATRKTPDRAAPVAGCLHCIYPRQWFIQIAHGALGQSLHDRNLLCPFLDSDLLDSH